MSALDGSLDGPDAAYGPGACRTCAHCGETLTLEVTGRWRARWWAPCLPGKAHAPARDWRDMTPADFDTTADYGPLFQLETAHVCPYDGHGTAPLF